MSILKYEQAKDIYHAFHQSFYINLLAMLTRYTYVPYRLYIVYTLLMMCIDFAYDFG